MLIGFQCLFSSWVRVSLLAFTSAALCHMPMDPHQHSFTIDYGNNCFLKDGKPFRYISGSMHYFRVPRCHWHDRLKKMRAAGLNAVETYIAWHVHEQNQGQYDFSGDNDIIEFIQLAQKNDLLVILRPGPFIDAEREFGGLPPWLLKKKNIQLRTSKDQFFMDSVQEWFSILLPKLKPFVYSNGGPIIMFQIENEYGSYFACDKEYLQLLEMFYKKYLASDVIYFSVDDGFREKEILCGSLPTIFKTVDFGPLKDVPHGFDILRKIQPKGPLVNTEYYTGWLDRWGAPHQRRSTEIVVEKLDIILQKNASVNLYMFEGGTNFGFMNGAELTEDDAYKPEPTSYDYDAPLNEAGDPTEKYFAIRKLISKYEKLPPEPVPGPTPKTAYGKVQLTKMITVFDALQYLVPKGPIKSTTIRTMEDIDQAYGFILYRAMIGGTGYGTNSNKVMIHVDALRDRSVIMVDQVLQKRIDRCDSVKVEVDAGKQLDILVENQGRVNYKYGSFTSLYDPKGILGNVTINGKIVDSWEIFPLPMNNTNLIPWQHIESKSRDSQGIPSFYYGEFTANEVNDTFLKTGSWTKMRMARIILRFDHVFTSLCCRPISFPSGLEHRLVFTSNMDNIFGNESILGQAFINNFNVGRYWPVMGPQETLYVPKSALNQTSKVNNILLFEIDGTVSNTNDFYVDFIDKPLWKEEK